MHIREMLAHVHFAVTFKGMSPHETCLKSDTWPKITDFSSQYVIIISKEEDKSFHSLLSLQRPAGWQILTLLTLSFQIGSWQQQRKASAAPTQRTIQTRNCQNDPRFKDSPLSPWLLIPALRSRAIWASSLSFSSFFSFSFWAIFFSTWALISTASLAYGNDQDFSISIKYGIFKKSVHIMWKYNHSESHNQWWILEEYLSISNVERLGQLGKVFINVNCL